MAQVWIASRGPILREERGILRVIDILRLLEGVQVVEHAGVLIEAVQGGQVLIAVAEVILAELSGGITEGLEQLRDGRVLVADPLLGTGHAHLGQTDAEGTLARDESGAARRAALLAVVIGEEDTFFGDAVDVGRLVAHQPVGVDADIRNADIIAHDDEDVRFLGLRHETLRWAWASAAKAMVAATNAASVNRNG